MRTCCIVGNIGSGKSTLTRFLEQAIPDSVAVLEDFSANPFLEAYMKNPSRWAFANAVRYFYDYARVYRNATSGRTFARCFIDAGGASNRWVYGNYLRQARVMTEDEYAFYDILCDLLTRAYAYPEPDAYIFLRAAPELCFERMKQRGWGYQTENIALDYIRALQPYFDSFERALREKQIPVLELDSALLDFTRAAEQAKIAARVRAFLGD